MLSSHVIQKENNGKINGRNMQSYLVRICPKLCQCPGQRFRIIQHSENTKQNLSLFVSFTRLVAEQEPRRLVRSPSMHCSPLGLPADLLLCGRSDCQMRKGKAPSVREGDVLFWRNSEVVTLRHDNELWYRAVCTRVTWRKAEN